jgi:hypothetical protein
MSATLAPQGLVPSRHPSGAIRIENLVDGIVSGFTSNIFTGSPIKRDTNGTLIPTTTTAADPCIGSFQGCEFTASQKRFVLPYFPANQTYDAGSMIAKYTMDPAIIYAIQANGPVAATANGEGANLANNTQGSTFTGYSSQALNATTTGATAATFQIVGLYGAVDNAWGDAFTVVEVRISAYQGQVA